ncbi:MAG TPA: hypothetical protein VHD84_01350 [Candidatus Saccharimonadales bacterium]|nr:hypothetical protein [Candidatus Saccharimonadales bacterium]
MFYNFLHNLQFYVWRRRREAQRLPKLRRQELPARFVRTGSRRLGGEQFIGIFVRRRWRSAFYFGDFAVKLGNSGWVLAANEEGDLFYAPLCDCVLEERRNEIWGARLIDDRFIKRYEHLMNQMIRDWLGCGPRVRRAQAQSEPRLYLAHG